MLPKKYRLVKNKDFQRVFRKGKYISERDFFLQVKFFKNNLSISRFGFVVSNKVSNKASVRNKVKRILREAVKRMLPELKSGLDVVIVAQKGIEEKSFTDVLSAVSSILKKIR